MVVFRNVDAIGEQVCRLSWLRNEDKKIVKPILEMDMRCWAPAALEEPTVEYSQRCQHLEAAWSPGRKPDAV
jgi:hypothetical protein